MTKIINTKINKAGTMSVPLPPDRHLLSTDEVAARLQVKRETVRKWVRTGQLPAYRIGPVLVRIDAQDLEIFLQPMTPTIPPRRPPRPIPPRGR